jgi:hypothetical protein
VIGQFGRLGARHVVAMLVARHRPRQGAAPHRDKGRDHHADGDHGRDKLRKLSRHKIRRAPERDHHESKFTGLR